MTVADETYRVLSLPDAGPGPRFDQETLADLPAPAQRFLRRTLPDGVELRSTIHLDLTGQIKLGGRWFSFNARQLLSAGKGYVWQPTVRGRLLRFRGADTFGPSGAIVDFRLFGKVPVVHAIGPGVNRSAAGRLAAETVAWIPQALTPQLGARWEAVDDRSAIVILDAQGCQVAVEVDIADDGRLLSICLDRWNEGATPPQLMHFGATMHTEFETSDRVLIAGAGTVGWHWHTSGEEAGHFYRFRIDQTSPVNPIRPGGEPTEESVSSDVTK